MDKRKILVILQARSSSSRLPGKVNKEINGYPVACLAAKRAGNTGLNVIVATSNEASDDELVKKLTQAQINYYRGSLSNVFSRFYTISKDLSPDAIIVRLTADNVFPDGKFIEHAVNEFNKTGADYIRSSTNLPYGLSVEVFTKNVLEVCAQNVLTPFEQEHVTPKIRKVAGDREFQDEKISYNNLRCTIDYEKDFRKISKIFKEFSNPIEATYGELLESLWRSQNSIDRICIGTAQLGLDYGISNIMGKPSKKEAFAILDKAYKVGIRGLDTARGYGTSEEVIGEFCHSSGVQFDVITKLTPFLFGTDKEVVLAVEKSVQTSLSALKQDVLDTVLLHRFSHTEINDGLVIDTLERLKSQGLIRNLGISIQNPDELQKCSKVNWVSHIQLPFNVLDSRWSSVETNTLSELSHKATIHARSLFLQGLVFLKSESLWPSNIQSSSNQVLRFFETLTSETSLSIKEVCLKFGLSKSWIDACVIGIANKNELEDVYKLFDQNPRFEDEKMKFIENSRPLLPNELLDPSQWRSNA